MSHYIFYKIVCEDCPDYIYIGSTKSFRSRKYQHKTCCNNEKINLKIYQKIRENGGWDNWNMIIIDESDNLTFTQARIKEEELRLKFNGNLNSNKAYITEEDNKEQKREYALKNKEKKREYDLKYRENNKEKKGEYDKEYYEKNKEKIKEYNEKNKEKIKEYYRQYNKQYYQKKKAEKL
tara:strand:+ start:1558 stop:2094 length:537 start_codon:yes stop_codon:yes gene_type:complete